MKPKNRKSFSGFMVVCVLILIGVICSAGYRVWMLFTTDWREVFERMRPVDYLITLMILIMILAIHRMARSKP
jgi:TRAP-type C4-dicarboxylate transport system permease small subunit